MNKCSLTLMYIILLINIPLYASAQDDFKFYDNGELHKKITSAEPKVKHTTYFIIAAQTNLSVNTGSSAIINAYNDMRSVSATMPVYFVLNNNGGVPPKDIDWYLKNIFRLKTDTDTNLYIIQNKALYDVLHYGGPVSKMYYIYNSMLAYKENAKYHFITDVQLPKHKYRLEESKIIKLLSDTIRLSYLDYFKVMSENKMLFLTDIQNKILVFDLQTGKISKQYELDKSGVDYYCDLIAETQAECDTARKHNAFLEGLNRKNYYIFNMACDDNHVYLSVGIQVIVRLKKSFSVKSDEGKKEDQTNDAGELFGYGYNMMAVLDKDLKPIRHYYMPEDESPAEDVSEAMDVILIPKNDTTVISALYYDKLKKDKPLFAQYRLSNKKVTFDKYLPPLTGKHFVKVEDANIFDFYCRFNGSIHVITDNDKHIYNINKADAVSELTGDGTSLIKERLPKYFEETEEIRLNYIPASMSATEQNLFVVYKYKDRWLLEIKDKTYKTVDVINLSFINGVDQVPDNGSGENIELYKNKLYIKYISGDSYYMSVYDINKIKEEQKS